MRLLSNYRAGQPNQLTGQRVASPGDLAILAQIYRDPRFETFRVFFMREGRVVAENAYTSRLPAAVRFNKGFTGEVLADYQRHDADSYYILHNHPSGQPNPSSADAHMTRQMARVVPGFAGHMVVDHNEYGMVDARGQTTTRFLDFENAPQVQSHIGESAAARSMLGERITNEIHVAAMAKRLEADPNQAVIVQTTAPGHVQSIVSVPVEWVSDTRLPKNRRGAAQLARLARETGAGGFRFLVLPESIDAEHVRRIKDHARAGRLNGVFTDVSIAGERTLLQQRVIRQHKTFDTTRKRSYRLAEGTGIYDPSDPTDSSRQGELFGTGAPEPAAVDTGDLFGDDVARAQALADEIRRRDARRSPGTDVPADIDGGLFSSASRQRDLIDVIANTAADDTPQPMDFETFASRRGAARGDMGDAGLHKRRRGQTDKQWKRLVESQRRADSAWQQRRDDARQAYDEAVARGEIRALTRRERLERTAAGHDDNESVQAARRMLARMNENGVGEIRAPNGQPSNLNARQHAQVRTPAFIAWFGDWLGKARLAALRDMPAARINAQPRADESRPALRRAMREAYRTLQDLAADALPVTSDGRTVQFGNKGFRETKQHSADTRVLRLVPQLPELIEQAIPLFSTAAEPGNAGNVVNFHHYGIKAEFADGPAYVRLLLRELTDGTFYYDNNATDIADIEKALSGPPLLPQQQIRSDPAGSGPIDRLVEWARRVNAANVSQVVDDNGEPLVVYHVTDADFEAFDPARTRYDHGIYLTPRADYAGGYANAFGDRPAGGHVMPLFARIITPAYMLTKPANNESGTALNQRQIDEYTAQGHDGLVVGLTAYEHRTGAETITNRASEVVAFDPTQIKSATANRGTYDPADARINYSRPDPTEAEQYRRSLDEAMAADTRTRPKAALGQTPIVLRALGVPDLPITIRPAVVRKATINRHNVPMRVIRDLPELLSDPVAVFDSATQANARVVLIQAQDDSARPVIVPLHIRQAEDEIRVNRVASVYGRNAASRFVKQQIDAGRLRYVNTEKARAWARPLGLRLPVGRAHGGPSTQYITQDDLPSFARAYHGTPHQFDRFSLEAIGTGEGAQTYGWGLYFAGQRQIAEFYRDKLAHPGRDSWSIDGHVYPGTQLTPSQSDALHTLKQVGYDFNRAVSLQEQMVARASKRGRGDRAEKTLSALRGFKGRAVSPAQPNLYQVDVPEADELLDWNVRLDQQPIAVRRALDDAGLGQPTVLRDGMPLTKTLGVLRIGRNPRGGPAYEYETPEGVRGKLTNADLRRVVGLTDEAPTGQAIYNRLETELGSARAASQRLNDLGIPGLRYLDAGSRDSAGNDSHNYVIWDEDQVTVEAVNDEQRQAEAAFARPTNEPADADQARERVAAIEAALADTLTRVRRHIPVEVSPHPPETIFGRDAAGVEGAYDRANARILIFGRNIATPERAAQVLRHEAIGHFSFERLLGDLLAGVLADVKRLSKNGALAGMAERVARRYPKLDRDSDTFAKETIAAMAEHPTNLPIWQRIVAAVRRFLRRLKLLDGVNESELRALIARAGRLDPAAGRVVSIRPAPYAASAPVPTFYSNMSQVLADKLPNKGQPAAIRQAINAFAKKGQIKPDELDWSGLTDWLDGQTGAVTKAQVLEALAARTPELVDTLYGDGLDDTAIDKWLKERDGVIERAGDGYVARYDGDELGDRYGTEHEAREALRDIARDDMTEYRGLTPAQYDEYQLPGGSGYRELLIRLPDHRGTPDDTSILLYGRPYDELTLDQRGAVNVNRADDAAARRNYQSSHFSEPNILAHLRLNTRTDGDGRRVLFLEEIQSDWHQAGRKKGYGDKPATPVEIGGGKWALAFSDGSRMGEYENRAAAQANAEKYQSKGVPDAPFKKTWPVLAIKRAIRYAADNGHERVAWTTGAQQAERFDLSQTVRSLLYHDNGDGTYAVSAQIGGRGQMLGEQLDQDEMAEYVGKEIAEKIVRGDGQSTEVQGRYRRMTELSGVDLQMGGEGMKAFYDKMLPSTVNKYIKRYQAKVAPGYVEGAGTVLGFDVTPAMREAAAAGQPLFARPLARASVALRDLLERALRDKRLAETVEIGAVAADEVREARAHGLNIAGYTHTVDSYALRHAINEHADAAAERARGQLPLSESDVAAIPNVVNEPDQVIYGAKNRRRMDQIIYVKRLDDGTALYVTEARRKRRRLAMESLRKYPTATRATSIVKSLGLNARNDGGDRLSIVTRDSKDNGPSFSRPDAATAGGAPEDARPASAAPAADSTRAGRPRQRQPRARPPVKRADVRLIGRNAEGQAQAAARVENNRWVVVVHAPDLAGGFAVQHAANRAAAEAIMVGRGLDVTLDAPPPETPPGQSDLHDDTLEPPEAGYLGQVGRWVRHHAQNMFEALHRLTDAAEAKRGEALSDNANPRQAETLYHGRTRTAMDDFDEQRVDPLLEALRQTGFRLDAVGDYVTDLDADLAERFGHLSAIDAYLYARHAPEANARLAEINPGESAMSGMSDDQAARMTAALEARGESEQFQAIAARVDDITAATRDLLAESGLEKRQLMDEWARMYQFYVPLKGEPGGPSDTSDFEPAGRTGRGFDTRGSASKRRLGRQIVAGHYTTIQRAQKNGVAQSMLRFAQDHPSRLYEVDTPMTQRVIDPVTGLVRLSGNPSEGQQDHIFKVRVAGIEHHIVFDKHDVDAQRMVRRRPTFDTTRKRSYRLAEGTGIYDPRVTVKSGVCERN